MRKTKFLFVFIFLFLIFVLAACNSINAVSVVDAEINDNNELVFELSDGTFLNVGVVVGEDGTVGQTGPQGLPGVDGVGIESITVNDQGELVVVLTDDTEINLGVSQGKRWTKW